MDAVKSRFEQNSYSEGKTGSLRQLLKTTYSAGMIEEEELWLEALVSRNNVAHAYNKEIVLELVRDTKAVYFKLFETLADKLRDEWLA